MNHYTAVRLGLEWCGLCYAAARGRSPGRGHGPSYAQPPKGRTKWMALQRYVAPSPTAPSLNGSSGTGEVVVSVPTVIEFLSCSTWEDGKSRVTGTILLMADDGVFKACLHDRDGGVSVFVSGRSVGELLETCEKGLREGGLAWRTDKPRRGR